MGPEDRQGREYMELRQLKTFKTVADQESFTRAAKALHMAQSSVSAQVKALEEELSVRLFDRIGRQITITEAGKSLYDYARRMAEMTREIRSEVSGRDSADAGGTLIIRVPETLASVYMPDIIEAYHRMHPWIRLVFMNCSDTRLKEELNAGKIDLAFLLFETVTFRDMSVKILGTEELVMTAGRNHYFTGKKNITYQDLAGQTLLLPKTE